MQRHPDVQHIVLNHKFAAPSADARHYKSYLAAQHLPAAFDISYKGPGIWDQGNIGSCTAHATLRCVVYAANHHTDQHKQPHLFHSRPSRLYEYANSRILENVSLDDDSGCTIEDAFRAVAKYSVPDEMYWQYDTSKFNQHPPVAAYDAAHKFKYFTYKAVQPNLIAIKQSILNGFPVAYGIRVYDSFMADACISTGIVPMPDTATESLQGGHAICATGWDDHEKMITFANSWGTTVGLPEKKGYFKMPYAYIQDSNLSSDFWMCDEFS